MDKRFCEECKCLNLTEKEQQVKGNNYNHFCNKYKTNVYHMGLHPNIVRCYDCKNSEVKNEDDYFRKSKQSTESI